MKITAIFTKSFISLIVIMNFLSQILKGSKPKDTIRPLSNVTPAVEKTKPTVPEFSSAPYDPTVPGISVVCISDTHGLHLNEKMVDIPPADLIIHAGDMTSTGTLSQLESFVSWFEELPHPNKVFIAGNHDITIDTEYYVARGCKRFHSLESEVDPREFSQQCRRVFTSREKSCYLEDSAVYISPCPGTSATTAATATATATADATAATADATAATADATAGAKCVHLVSESDSSGDSADKLCIYGSPWQPEFCDWAFNLERGPDSARVWAKIPANTDVLITHGPPQGYGDFTSSGFACGCEDMLAVLKDMQTPPRVHIFGHIHEAYGHWTDGKTLFINASTCTFLHKPLNKPLLFHLPFDKSLPATIINY